MIIAIAFLLFAVNSVIFVVTGDWLNGISALALAIAWGGLTIRAASHKVDRLIQEAAPRLGIHPDEESATTAPCLDDAADADHLAALSDAGFAVPDAGRDEEKS